MVEVLTGKNTQALHRYVQANVAEFKANHNGSIEQFDGLESISYDDVLDAVRSISFLEPQKLVVVRNFSQNKSFMDRVASIVESAADSTTVLLVDQAIDKRTVAFKELKKQTTIKDFTELKSYELEDWVITTASELQATILKPVARHLIERVGTSQLQLYKELEKLSITSTVISKESVDNLTEPSPQSKIFDMLEVVFSGDGEKAWRLYGDQRAQGEEPQKIMAMITWQLQQLVLASYAPSRQALIASGTSPYTADKSLQAIRTITKDNLVYYVRRLAEIDAQIKTSADVSSALELYITEVANRQRATSS